MNIETLIAVATFAECNFEPDDIVEVRLIPSGRSTWHRAGDLHDESERLLEANRRNEHIYVGGNPRRRVGGTTADDVPLARSLWVDLDGGCTTEEAKARIKHAKLPLPTMLVESGGGVHAWWRLVEPITDLAEFTRHQKRLIAATGGDSSIHDPPRIMRLPGFLNCKAKYGEPRPCRIIAADSERRYFLNEVVGHLPEVMQPAPASYDAPAAAGLTEYARAAAYVAKIPGETEGGRNATAFRVGALLVKDFNLAVGDARQLLDMWNQKNNPPLEDAELADVLQHAVEYGSHPPGQKLMETARSSITNQVHATNGQVRGTAEAATAYHEPVTFQRITAAELDAGEWELEYLIEGTMTVGQPLILAGGKKNLKTNILLDAAISIASGTPFLGKLTVNRKARVAIMTGESGLATIQETCRRICRAKGLRLPDVEGLIVSPDIPRAELLDHMAALEEFIRHDGTEVLAIDPAYMSLPGDDAGNMFKQGTMLRELAAVCTRAGASLILAHHTKKNIADPFKPPELEDIAWSGFQEFARQWWMLSRREPFQPGSGEHKLWLNIGGSAGHSALWALDIREGVYDGHTPRVWDVELLSANDAREAAKQGQAEQRAENARRKRQVSVEECKAAIEQAFIGIPLHTETKRTIEDRSGRKGKAFDEAFAYLLRTGRIKETQLTRANNQQYAAFQFKFEGAKE